MNGEDFVPGVYQHFKGIVAGDGSGFYYAAGVAVNSETREDPEVVYWSYALGHWNRRPLFDRPGVPASKKCGWLDPVDRAGYRGPRFVLVRAEAFVPPAPGAGAAIPPGAP
jgi:hypothetical protein